MRCECWDVHDGHGLEGDQSRRCNQTATSRLYRLDMVDLDGTWFCDHCAEDAADSGLFDDGVGIRLDEEGPPYDAATKTGMYDWD